MTHLVQARAAEPTRRLLAKVTLYYLVALLAAGGLTLLQPTLGVPVEIIELNQFAPTLGVLVVLACWRGNTWPRPAGRPGGRLRAAVLLAGPLLIAALYLLGGVPVGLGADGDALPTPVVLLVAAQLVGGCGEALGWRCFLQPLLQARLGMLPAAVVVGLLWGAWHVQVFAAGPAYAVSFLLTTASLSVILAVTLPATPWRRLVLAGAFHAMTNLATLLLFDGSAGWSPMALFGLASLVMAVVVARFVPAGTGPVAAVRTE